MTGERQPGGRASAPGELALVQAFINSHYDLELDHGADLFAAPRTLATWLSARDLLAPGESIGPSETRRAVAMREALRAVARTNGKPPAARPEQALAALDAAGRGAAVEIRFAAGGPRFVPAVGGLDRALGVVLARTARAMLDGSWARLKVCPGDDCWWAFYDHSRNQSGRWCSMAVCGGRAKARAHYHRQRGEI